MGLDVKLLVLRAPNSYVFSHFDLCGGVWVGVRGRNSMLLVELG